MPNSQTNARMKAPVLLIGSLLLILVLPCQPYHSAALPRRLLQRNQGHQSNPLVQIWRRQGAPCTSPSKLLSSPGDDPGTKQDHKQRYSPHNDDSNDTQMSDVGCFPTSDEEKSSVDGPSSQSSSQSFAWPHLRSRQTTNPPGLLSPSPSPRPPSRPPLPCRTCLRPPLPRT